MIKKLLIGVTTLLASTTASFAHVGPDGGPRGGSKPSGDLAANCLPSANANELNINNTRAVIQTGGDMWWDFTRAQYEIPKNSGHTALFAGALWLGGRDVSGQLKVAAQRFRSGGVDFWTGPLSTVDAEISAATCAEYDKHFLTTRLEVQQFVSWFELGREDAANGTNRQAELFPDYTPPRFLDEWPAHGRNFAPYNEDYNLAPFVDIDNNGEYDPTSGDYPAYDLNNSADCKAKIVNIYGDQNLWWVFNDMGNVHTETGAGAIGMEIRAQAFAFATNDEVNNMTFYNYELVNRSTFTLQDTYFGQWVDADLGCSQDDYVGCDVQRGLGYAYNGDNNDEDCRGVTGYGAIPPAIGVDFFQGPFQDADGIDNPLTTKYSEAIAQDGIPYAGIGIGYGDGVIDNERFGMRKFLYHNNDRGTPISDPVSGVEYYNYLRSIWRDGSGMVYGGTGHPSAGGTIPADYMFPGDTDPLGWGTGGVPQPTWTEVTAGNTPNDRRFMQSAGPFVLEPGAVNNITVGVVWARATNGDNESSVLAMRNADDKTQALFDNCFQLLNGPDAPDLTITELENELILYLNNPVTSNNYREAYAEQDPTIIPSIDDTLTDDELDEFRTYRFQGYKVYQVADNSVGPNDLGDVSKARLIAQVDIKDSVTNLVNYYFDSDLGTSVPQLEVEGANQGIQTSFQVFQDAFADGDNRLINNKAYYFMALSYAYNGNTEEAPYLGSRKGTTGSISAVKGIPHNTRVQNGGSTLNSKYGDGVQITRLEGAGNGGNVLELETSTVEEILENNRADNLVYQKGSGPVNIKVVDPISVKPGNFTLWFLDTASNGDLQDASWMITGDQLDDTIYSFSSIDLGSEVIVFDLGISIDITQSEKPGSGLNRTSDQNILEIGFDIQDSANLWLNGIPDVDGNNWLNWILSGSQASQDQPGNNLDESIYDDWNYYQAEVGTGSFQKRGEGLDDGQVWEQQLEGVIAPFRMTAQRSPNGPVPNYLRAAVNHYNPGNGQDRRPSLWLYDKRSFGDSAYYLPIDSMNQLNYLSSVDVVFTSDKSKWTRCPVFEMRDSLHESEGNAIRGQLRDAPSVDKNGNGPNDAGYNAAEATMNGTQPRGMGWFPGYAIDLETGERLNMGFGEDSYLVAENGRDMVWNPTENIAEGPQGEMRGGGMHYVYVFRNNIVEDEVFNPDMPDSGAVATNPILPFFEFDQNLPENRMPLYDEGKFIYEKMKDVQGYMTSIGINGADLEHVQNATSVFRSAMYVMFLRAEPLGGEWLNTDIKVRIRMNKPYRNYGTGANYVSKGEPLEVGKEYYVNAGPVKHFISSDQDSVFYTGMHFVAANTEWKSEYRNSGWGGNDETNVLMESINGGRPTYGFTTTDLAPSFNNNAVAEDQLSEIRVVPNPYYAYSSYETDKIDNRVRIVNLPKTCTLRFYTVDGTLVRTLEKDDDTITFLEWDLKNQDRVPVASGVYIIHVDAPGIGETVLKWMGVMRPISLDNF